MSLAPEPIPLAREGGAHRQPRSSTTCSTPLDEDFGELFKVKVDFDDSLPRTPDFEELYARFVAGACRDEGLPAFAPDGDRRA